jgi:hypothetical protein
MVVLLLVAGFVWYMIASMNGGTVEYGMSPETGQADSASAYAVMASFALPEGTQRLRLAGDTCYLATTDSIFLYSKDGVCLNRFHAGTGVVDIAVADDGIYVLYIAAVKVFTPGGQPVREWEACSDYSGYCSIALTADHAFVTDAENQNICQYTREGGFVRFINSPRGFVIPTYTFDVESYHDTVYCVNSGRHQIESYTVAGAFIASFGIPGSAPGSFPGCCNPAGIVFTRDGRLLTSEKGNPRVCLFERSGRFVSLLLNSKALGGGHEAYEIQTDGRCIYAAGKNRLTIYQLYLHENL